MIVKIEDVVILNTCVINIRKNYAKFRVYNYIELTIF